MQPRLTQVPPSAASSATATRAPRSAASRPARTPPLPAPTMKRSNSALLMGSPLRSLQRFLQQLGDQAVDAVGAAGALFAQRRRKRRRQLAGERHESGGSVLAALLAPVGDLGCALREAAGDSRRLHVAADLACEELVEIGLLHAHERPATSCET